VTRSHTSQTRDRVTSRAPAKGDPDITRGLQIREAPEVTTLRRKRPPSRSSKIHRGRLAQNLLRLTDPDRATLGRLPRRVTGIPSRWETRPRPADRLPANPCNPGRRLPNPVGRFRSRRFRPKNRKHSGAEAEVTLYRAVPRNRHLVSPDGLRSRGVSRGSKHHPPQ
jgi:hypothetical protein